MNYAALICKLLHAAPPSAVANAAANAEHAIRRGTRFRPCRRLAVSPRLASVEGEGGRSHYVARVLACALCGRALRLPDYQASRCSDSKSVDSFCLLRFFPRRRAVIAKCKSHAAHAHNPISDCSGSNAAHTRSRVDGSLIPSSPYTCTSLCDANMQHACLGGSMNKHHSARSVLNQSTSTLSLEIATQPLSTRPP